MLYSILIYGSEAVVETFTDEQEEAVLAKHYALQDKLEKSGKLGPFARLMHTTAAVTIRADKGETVILDGPFAETKEQLLGLYMVECKTLAEAVETAKGLPLDTGSLEVRPVHYYKLGILPEPEYAPPMEAEPKP